MHSLLLLILQMAIILLVARLVGLVFRFIRQPQVVGEMVAGIMLGPSLLGWVAPVISAALFPVESLGFLEALSQIGLLLFMFLIGLELNPKLLRGHSHAALITSHVSITVPFFLGTLLALYLYPRLSDNTVSFTGFALFMGAAMSVTAFPVLARILIERNLLRTKVGALTIACAAVDDVTAWCILAFVVVVVRAEEAGISLWFTLGGTSLYILFMLFVVRPGLKRLEAYYLSRGQLTQDITAIILFLLLISSLTTEWLGIHALFGAFIIGAVMPKGREFVHDISEKLEHVTVVFLLPLFFAFAGLRTSIGLVQGGEMWLFTFIILVVAIVGKFGGSTLASRLSGLSWREAGALGTLMNTRGLIELVILTIGLDLGIISPALFTMMVLMAIITTFMTTPILEWIYPARLIREKPVGGEEEIDTYTVLVPVALPSSGPGLLQIAVAASRKKPRIYGLNLIRPSEYTYVGMPIQGTSARESALQPLLDEANKLGVETYPISFVSSNPGRDIVGVAHSKGADLIIMGWHKPVVSQSVLSGTVSDVMTHARADVAVYLQRSFRPWKRILVPYRGGIHDRAAIQVAARIAEHSNAEITVLHVIAPGTIGDASSMRSNFSKEYFPAERVNLEVVESDNPQDAAIQYARDNFDIIIIGVSEDWGLDPALFNTRHERLARETPSSLLIVRKYVSQDMKERASVQTERARTKSLAAESHKL